MIERHPLMKSSSAVPKPWLPRLRYYTESPTPQDTRHRTVPCPSSRRRPFEPGAHTGTRAVHTVYNGKNARTYTTGTASRVSPCTVRVCVYTARTAATEWVEPAHGPITAANRGFYYFAAPHAGAPLLLPPTHPPHDSRPSSSERPRAATAVAAPTPDILLLGVFCRCSFFFFFSYNIMAIYGAHRPIPWSARIAQIVSRCH